MSSVGEPFQTGPGHASPCGDQRPHGKHRHPLPDSYNVCEGVAAMPDPQPKPTAAEVLRSHLPVDTSWDTCTCGWDGGQLAFWRHQEDVLAAAGLLATPEHDAQVAAQALRDAAQDMRGVRSSDGPLWVENVLNDWADRIEGGDPT